MLNKTNAAPLLSGKHQRSSQYGILVGEPAASADQRGFVLTAVFVPLHNEEHIAEMHGVLAKEIDFALTSGR